MAKTKFIIKNKWLNQGVSIGEQLKRLLLLDQTVVTTLTDSFEMEIPGEVIGKLTSREQRALFLRYSKGLTREAMGKDLNVTRERAFQIEGKALRKVNGLMRTLEHSTENS